MKNIGEIGKGRLVDVIEEIAINQIVYLNYLKFLKTEKWILR
jgi:hypothetical protein